MQTCRLRQCFLGTYTLLIWRGVWYYADASYGIISVKYWHRYDLFRWSRVVIFPGQTSLGYMRLFATLLIHFYGVQDIPTVIPCSWNLIITKLEGSGKGRRTFQSGSRSSWTPWRAFNQLLDRCNYYSFNSARHEIHYDDSSCTYALSPGEESLKLPVDWQNPNQPLFPPKVFR